MQSHIQKQLQTAQLRLLKANGIGKVYFLEKIDRLKRELALDTPSVERDVDHNVDRDGTDTFELPPEYYTTGYAFFKTFTLEEIREMRDSAQMLMNEGMESATAQWLGTRWIAIVRAETGGNVPEEVRILFDVR